MRRNDPNNEFALEKMKGLGIDIYGEHKDRFQLQGGPTGAKATGKVAEIDAPGAVTTS